MGQLMRQIGIVIGLTVILTFPVTVVSGAGSQKQSDHMSLVVGVTGGGQVHGAIVMARVGTERLDLHEPRR